MHVIQNLLTFIKSPVAPEQYSTISFKAFVVLLLALFIIIIPYGLLIETIGLDQFDHKMEEFVKSNKFLVIFAVAVLAPVLEELVFRYHLNFKKSSVLIGYAISFIFTYNSIALLIIATLYFGFIFIKLLLKQQPDLKFCIYTSTTLFALVHLTNFGNFDLQQHFYWVPLLVGAQFVIGLVLSFIRVSHGIYTSILFHGVYNAVLVIPAIYFAV